MVLSLSLKFYCWNLILQQQYSESVEFLNNESSELAICYHIHKNKVVRKLKIYIFKHELYFINISLNILA